MWQRLQGRFRRFDLVWVVLAGVAFAVALSGASATRDSRATEPESDVSATVPDATVARLAPVAAIDPLPEAAPPPAVAEPPVPELLVTEGSLKRGESLARALGRQGISARMVHVIDRQMRPHFNFRRAQPGHEYRLVRDADGQLVEFRYKTSDLGRYLVVPDGTGYRAEREEVVLVARRARMAGVVTRSLHGAVVDLGEKGQLANDFAEIFAWDIDFSRSVHSGDAFRILYERLYMTDENGEEQYVRPGRILAAHYEGAGGGHTAFYYEQEPGRGGYYRPDGSSVQRQFLRAPLRYSRISSSFTGARRHPILKVTRPHHGIDYAAPSGTPIWSVADGEVIYRGWAGGFGNLVKIRHANGFVSYYAHLSNFAKGLRVGDDVRQKQGIGYVGQTGLATGPHVCFRIAQNGRFVNPTRLHTPAGDPVKPSNQQAFRFVRDSVLAELDGGRLVATEQAL